MRALVQRVTRATVTVAGETVGEIAHGLLVYAAATPSDQDADIDYVADKIAHLRIFPDGDGKMNLDVGQADGAVLLASAFTLCADARKGRRPSFDSAASGPIAEPLIHRLISRVRAFGVRVETGRFGADMRVWSENDGPICIPVDSTRAI